MAENTVVLDENQRESIPLNSKNARFFRSGGGLISLELTTDTTETFERVVLFRCFPITNPDEFISVREPDSKKMGRGKEIGMIRYITDFSEDVRALFAEELERRYFSPIINKIISVKEKFGYTYWETNTSAGPITFVLNNPFSNIRTLEDGRVFIADLDGNTFQIPNPADLDATSYKKIEMYF